MRDRDHDQVWSVQDLTARWIAPKIFAFGDERRVPALTVTRAELEQRRALSEPPVEVTRCDALASWGIETPPTDTPAADAAPEIPPTSTGRTNCTSRTR